MKLEINVKKVDDKIKSDSTILIDLLKQRGIPGSQAVQLYKRNSKEYLVRKLFLYDYYATKKNAPILSSMRWLQSAIKNDYKESDDFLNWYKAKKEYILNNGDDELKKLVAL